jgi:hypothetical protein
MCADALQSLASAAPTVRTRDRSTQVTHGSDGQGVTLCGRGVAGSMELDSQPTCLRCLDVITQREREENFLNSVPAPGGVRAPDGGGPRLISSEPL